MVRVTRCARRSGRLCGVMDGAIVAVETSVVPHFRGKCAGCLDVARGTFIFENSVCLGQTSAAVNAGVFQNRALGDPQEREQRQQDAEPEFHALQSRRPFEIIEVDALRQFLSCSRSLHSSLTTSLISQRPDSMNGAK